MKKRIAQLITIVMGVTVVFGLTVADFITQDRKFSQTENRILASAPEFSFKELFEGEYTSDFETYVTDQFVFRDQWIALKTASDIALGKKDVGGVYLTKDGGLIEKHLPSDIDVQKAQEKVTLLSELMQHYEEQGSFNNFHVMLAPTADNIQTHRLPNHAQYFDQKPFLEQVAEAVGQEHIIDLWDTLEQHKEEYIYYLTDHHWTTQGAYLAYLEWAEEIGVTPVSFDQQTKEVLSEEFLGTLHSKTNLDLNPDVMEGYKLPEDRTYQVYYDMTPSAKDSIYEEKYLDTKNKYGYFLDDNHGFVQIETGLSNGKTLFVIKDSYANCLVPFLTEHYETICIIDLRYCNMSLYQLIDLATENYAPEDEYDMLVLYNVIHFIEEFQYRK
ncbi:MAG: hypothetical protein IJW63_04515 [Lachnospiraceae bacterium]|nr:hypothetical protein [Lachnospiraceae bacterium]